MDHPSWKDLITECFKSTEFMALATNGDQGLWVNPVYFAWDDKFDLYFISQLDCLHMENIQSNPDVACAIYPTNRPAGSDVFGAYAKGAAHLLKDKNVIQKAAKFYYTRAGKDADSYKKDSSWHLVRVELKELWYLTRGISVKNALLCPNFSISEE